jgi:uncharacterized membrane protein YqhA
MMKKILTSSRFIVLIAIVGSFLASFASLLAGGIRTLQILAEMLGMLGASKGLKVIAYSFVEVVDLFLIGTVFYIIALGLYELFIDENIAVPDWLVIHSLDDLKAKLINGVIVIMGVYFLGALINWDGKTDLLQLSAAVSLMVAALTFFQYIHSHGRGSK